MVGEDNLLSCQLTLKTTSKGINVTNFYGTGLPDGANTYFPTKTRTDILNTPNGVSLETVFSSTFKYLVGNIDNTYKKNKYYSEDGINTEHTYYLYYAKSFVDSLLKQIEDVQSEINDLKKDVNIGS